MLVTLDVRHSLCVSLNFGVVPWAIDTPAACPYSLIGENGMPVRRVQMGQVWKKNGTEETYLVTKLYTEALTTVAMLRKTGAESGSMLRVKVERAGDSQTLPGFSFAHESEEH